MVEGGLAAAFITERVRAVWTLPWCQDRVLEVIVNELVPLIVCVARLVLVGVLQGEPFAAVGFDMSYEMAKMTTDRCWCCRCSVR
jgi:hypothetical protein